MDAPLERLVRRGLRDYAAYVPGTTAGDVRRRYGLERIVKLSSNENPLGTSPAALEALRSLSDVSLYEDRFEELRERLAAGVGLQARNVVLGHGSNEILQLLFTTFVDPDDEVVFSQPSFSLYRKDARVAGARAIEVPLTGGCHDLDGVLAVVSPRTKLVILDDPNNPTATRLDRDAARAFAAALDPGVLLVLDQAYFEYMDGAACDGARILRERPMTVVLRTASKIYGLAALRFGYAFASDEIASWLDRLRLPFNVSKPAAAAVFAALGDVGFVERSVRLNSEGRVRFEKTFARLGLHVYPSAANFVAVATPGRPDGSQMRATDAYEALLTRGVITRSGDALGLPGYLRVTIGTAEENDVFLAALEALASGELDARPAVGAAR